MNRSLTIEEDNLSVAWAKAMLHVFEAGEIPTLTVVIRHFPDGNSGEVPRIRRLLDDALGAGRTPLSCHEVANTIFPISLWNPQVERSQLYERYRRIMPRVLRKRRNRHGVYFQRLISFGHDSEYEGGVNQLEHIIQTWNGGNHRRSALQAAIFDPREDHSHQRQRGFPCLQQVAFAPQASDGLSVTGFYATQYMFQRAYGNYLGLSRLGRFVAHAIDRRLTQVTCVASPAVRDGTKTSLRPLMDAIREILDQAEVTS
ncbi:MAG: thymidylate synthase [Chloroflexota bacterium]|nr:thymidylate synthase [Chloroflexota bacterium]MDE2895762.1 thymidylate synthase [Chloroflexota bacterium]